MDNAHSQAIGFFVGIGALIVGWTLPMIYPNLPIESAYCILAIGVIFILGSFVALIRPHWFCKYDFKNRISIIGANKRSLPELSIIIGHEAPYTSMQIYNDVNVSKTVLVGVKNTGTIDLSNCKLFYELIDRETNASKTWLREDNFSLGAGKERYVSIASYSEPNSPNQPASKLIQLHAPPAGGYWDVVAPTIPSDGGAITLLAESAESRDAKTVLRMWVEENKLKWE